MPRSSLNRHIPAFFLGVLIALPTALVQASPEAYYSADIDDAVEAAQRNPLNSNYVGARWYNRTTSRSFGLPPMMNVEMGREVIEGAMGPTAAGEAAAAEAQQPARDSAMGRGNNNGAIDNTLADANGKNASADDREVERSVDISVREVRSATSVARDIRGSGISVKASLTP